MKKILFLTQALLVAGMCFAGAGNTRLRTPGIVEQSGIKGGLVVCIGVEDPEFMVLLRAKDSSVEHSKAERGKVTGTPVGCACGDGVIDWAKVAEIVRKKTPRDIVFRVECDTPDRAERSLKHLKGLL
jgi:hypothetical protein